MAPLSLLATFVGLTWRGIPANLLSLGAMDFGIIVDGAVIVMENIFRKLSEGEHSTNRDKVREIILHAGAEVGRPTFFSMLIIIVAHIPIFTLQRQEGRIFAPMAWTVTSALVGSLLFSLTLVPLLCWLLLRRNLPHKENALMRAAVRIYEPILRSAIAHPKAVIFTAVAALAFSLALTPKLGTEFLPELNEGTIWLNANFPSSLSVNEAVTYCRKIRDLLHTVPEVNTVVSKSGRPEDGTDPKPINMCECFVDLKPQALWRRGMTKEKVLAEMDHALDALPGVETIFSQPIRDNVLESISQIDGQVVIKVFGEDPAILREKVTEVLRKISSVAGVERAYIDRAGLVSQAIIEIDRDRAARYGLNVGDIEDEIEIGLGGKAATALWEGEKHERAMKRLAIIVPVSVFVIFVLLFDAFKSIKHSLLILLNVPFALIGGIIALLLTGIPLSVSAAIGFIALFGQAVLNGVVMLSCFQQLSDEGAHNYDAVLRGAMLGLPTVLMATLLAMLGLLPI